MQASLDEHAGTRLLKGTVAQLMTRDPVTVSPEKTLAEAAALLRVRRITALPVIEDGRLAGLLTQSALLDAVLRDPLHGEAQVRTVMERDPPCVRPEQPVLELLALMTRHGLAHVPVMTGDALVGIATQTDVVRRQTGSSVFLVVDIARADAAAAMAPAARQVPALLAGLVDAGASPREVGRVTTSVAGAATRRLIALAERELGPAPAAFAWLACGSQGRHEQITVTDQDNALLIENERDAVRHADWFAALARFVCDGLAHMGYARCEGDMMATNTNWRRSMASWKQGFAAWSARPDENARLATSFVADARAVAGDMALADTFRKDLTDVTRSNRFLLARMLGDALERGVALNLFGRLATTRDDGGRERLDLKAGAIAPIVDLARVHALARGSLVTNTVERLKASSDDRDSTPNERGSVAEPLDSNGSSTRTPDRMASDRVASDRGATDREPPDRAAPDEERSRGLSASTARELLAAHEFVGGLRLRHQTAQTRLGIAPDNALYCDSLSTLERDHLRRSLVTIRDVQSALERRVATTGF